MRSLRLGCLAMVTVIVAAVGGCAEGDRAPVADDDGVPVITIVGNDRLRFEPDDVEVEAGTYRVVFENGGGLVHQLALSSAGEHGPGAHELGDTGEIPGGETASFEVDLEPGTYEYACHVDIHYEAGMKGTLTVTE